MEQAAQILDVVRTTELGETLETTPVNHGLLHQSAQTLAAQTHYSANLPAGLHISCGVAKLSTRHPLLGGFEFDGPGLSVILCPQDADPFATTVAQGRSVSCGLFEGDDRLEAASDEILADIIERMRSGAALRATDRPPPGLVARLCTPVDPWFQGAARTMALEVERPDRLGDRRLDRASLRRQPDR